MDTQLSHLRSRLESMLLPLSSLNPHASQPLIGVKVDDLVDEVSHLCATDSAQLAWRHPELIGHSGMQRSRAWCGTSPILGVVNMVGTRNFTCYMGAL